MARTLQELEQATQREFNAIAAARQRLDVIAQERDALLLEQRANDERTRKPSGRDVVVQVGARG